MITSMPVGGAETLLVNLVRRLDRTRFQPELCCLKHFGPLGEVLAGEIPAFEGLLAQQIRFRRAGAAHAAAACAPHRRGGDRRHRRRQDVLGAAGRPASRRAGDSVGPALDGPARLRRIRPIGCWLPITDGFIGVAKAHGEYLARSRRLPGRQRCLSIPNGVDVERFRAARARRRLARTNLAWPPHRRWPRSSPRCGRRRTTSCFCEPPPGCARSCPTPVPDRWRWAAPRRPWKQLSR